MKSHSQVKRGEEIEKAEVDAIHINFLPLRSLLAADSMQVSNPAMKLKNEQILIWVRSSASPGAEYLRISGTGIPA